MKNIFAILIFLAFSTSLYAVVTELNLEHAESKTEMQALITSSGSDKHVVINSVINYLKALRAGGRNGKFDLQVGGGDAVASFVTVTFNGIPEVGETVVVGGSTLTVVANGSTVSPGITFDAGATITASAVNFASSVNDNSTLKIYLTATSSSSLTTVTSDVKGVIGNFITFSETLGEGFASSSTFAEGVNKTVNEYKFGY